MPRTVAETITDLRELGFSVVNLADLLNVSTRQIHRWHTVATSPRADDRATVEDLSHILDTLRRAGHDDDQIMGWFMRRHPDLTQRRWPTPYLTLRAGDFDRVVRLAETEAARETDGASA